MIAGKRLSQRLGGVYGIAGEDATAMPKNSPINITAWSVANSMDVLRVKLTLPATQINHWVSSLLVSFLEGHTSITN